MLVAAIAVVFFILFKVHQRQKKEKEKHLLRHFNNLGADAGLRFSAQELMRHTLIGIDGMQGKLIYLDEDLEGWLTSGVIDLQEVKNCTLVKTFGSDAQANTSPFINRVSLQFQFKDNRSAAAIVFYDHIRNNIYEYQGAEQKARHWEQMLCKLLRSPYSETRFINHKT
jgi:hypothetical protein